MGTIHAANPVHYDNGVMYRRLIAPINDMLEQTRPFVGINHKANRAYDLLLAKKAVYSAIYLSNDMRLSDQNETAKDYSKLAVNQDIFNKFFNYVLTEVTNG